MKTRAFGLALGISLLVLTGPAMSGETQQEKLTLAMADGSCPAAHAPDMREVLYFTSLDARQANRSRVRYSANHAMPPKRTPAATAAMACAVTGTSTVRLD